MQGVKLSGRQSSFNAGLKKEDIIPLVEPWEPRTKLIAGLIYVFGVIGLIDLRLLGAALLFALCFALWSGLAMGQLLKSYSLTPALNFLYIPLPGQK